MNNWELKAIAVLVMIGLIAVGVAYCQMGDGGDLGEDATWIVGAILMIIGSIAILISGFILLMAAFRHDVTTGLLFLFLPFYSIYFAISLYDGSHKGWVITGWLGGSIIVSIGIFLFYMGTWSEFFY